MKKELLIGCGSEHSKRLHTPGDEAWENLITLDNNSSHNPDILHDLRQYPLPFQANTFDEIHAYEVLEHLYPQGDYHSFFREFSEYSRILKKGGKMFITVPPWNSQWAFADPSHLRVMPAELFVFLSQEEYTKQVGVTAMSDFRPIYKADFKVVHAEMCEHATSIVLEVIK